MRTLFQNFHHICRYNDDDKYLNIFTTSNGRIYTYVRDTCGACLAQVSKDPHKWEGEKRHHPKERREIKQDHPNGGSGKAQAPSSRGHRVTVSATLLARARRLAVAFMAPPSRSQAPRKQH